MLNANPVAVGGIGGSGTRLVACILRELGYYIGGDLNQSEDNAWFTLLFKRPEVLGGGAEFRLGLSIFLKAMTPSGALTPAEVAWVNWLAAEQRAEPERWLAGRLVTLEKRFQSQAQPPRLWGWKEPNTHIVLDQLQAALPELKYIHVLRNGLDMAYSDNRNQLALWGPHFLQDNNSELSPRRTLRYWCVMQQRITRLASAMNGRFLVINYDRLCADPASSLSALAGFLGVELSAAQRVELSKLVKPGAVGRYKQFGLGGLDPADVAYVASLGFDTSVP